MHGVHRVRERGSVTSLRGVLGNLTKEIMPCRQRGQGTDPVGPKLSDEVLLVEQR